MDDSTKFILNQLNENITVLRNEMHEKTEELKEELKTFKATIISKKDCANIRFKNEINSGVKKEEFSLKKVTVICGTVSAVISLVVPAILSIFK